jgi:hypothetical protein
MNNSPAKHFWFSAILLVVLAACSQPSGMEKPKDYGVIEPFKPDHKITFPHEIHAGKNGIDCKFCHNAAEKGRDKGLPTAHNCAVCHKHATKEMLDTMFQQ